MHRAVAPHFLSWKMADIQYLSMGLSSLSWEGAAFQGTMLPTLSSVSKGSLREGAPWPPSPAAPSALIMLGVPRKQMVRLTMEDLFVIADEEWFAPLPCVSPDAAWCGVLDQTECLSNCQSMGELKRCKDRDSWGLP